MLGLSSTAREILLLMFLATCSVLLAKFRFGLAREAVRVGVVKDVLAGLTGLAPFKLRTPMARRLRSRFVIVLLILVPGSFLICLM